MGTTKKIVLASIVSMMLVLAFVIGLAPSHDSARSGASSGDGRIDMVGLLDLILGEDKAIGDSVLVSPVNGVVVKTPEDNAQVPEIPVPVQLSGDVDGLITFVANPSEDGTAWDGEGQTWTGDVFSEALSFPYAGALDVGPFLADVATNTQTSVAVYALLNAAAAGVKASTLQYEAATDAADALELTIFKRDSQVDSTDNGLPDDIFGEVGPGEIWISNVIINGVLRTVLIANADDGSAAKAPGTVFLQPNARTSIEAPNLDALVADGLVPNGESALIVVEVVDDLAGLVDSVGGDTSNTARSAWAAAVAAKAPGALTDGGQFVDISIVATSGGGFVEVDDLSVGTSGLLGVTLNVTGLAPGINEPTLHNYPTTIQEDSGSFLVTSPSADADWTEVTSAVFVGSSLSATVQTLSTFAPFNSGLVITGIDTGNLPQNYTADITITGVFPTLTALNIYEASQAYRVYIGGQVAAFRDGDPAKNEVAITAYDGVNENEAYVTAPAFAIAGASLDLEIVDLNNPGNNATLVDAFSILATGTISTSETGSIAGVTFALSPTNGPGLPAGAFFAGDNVNVTATVDPSETIAGWSVNGADQGTTANPLAVTVVEGLNAVVLDVDVAGFVLDATATTGGSVAIDPAQPLGGYAGGTVVELTATADPGFNFIGWTGADAGDLAPDAATAVVTITMDADKTVVANFEPIAINEFTVTTAVTGIGGTAAVVTAPNGSGPGLFLDGTVVTIAATPAAGFTFAGWVVVGATAADAAAATTTVTVNGAAVLATASFSPVVGLSVTGIAPNEAWLFGGIVATVTGTGLTDGTVVSIGGNNVTGFRAAENGTSVDILIPASSDNSTLASFSVDVSASNGNGNDTLANAFTYKRYDTDADGVNYTAFIVGDNAAGETLDVTLGAPHVNFAELVLPGVDADATVFGLVRNAQNTPDAKLNTQALGALGTAGIAAGQDIANVFDFSLHLYQAVQEAKNTPPAGSAAFGIGSGAGLVDFGRPVDALGNPVASESLLLTFPINGAISDTGINYGDVGNGLTMWGVASSLDYATNAVTVSDPLLVEYQSQILNNEVDPARTAATDPNAEPNLVREARLYTLNGFSLRQGAVIPAEVAGAVRLDTPSGTANDNTPGGPTNGGTELRVVSPLGGLGYVDRVVFAPLAGSTAGGTVTTFQTAEGSNEFELRLQAPTSQANGIVDIVIFMKANPTLEAVRLSRAYEYVAEPRAFNALWLVLLGVLIAIIGLAAGGNSGGGGGGPCFIATAAYGTPMAAEIDTLRAVRDTYLLSNPVGTAFTDVYYRVSPALADVVADSPVLAALVRVLLVPVVFLGKVALTMPVLTALVGISLGFWFASRRKGARKA